MNIGDKFLIIIFLILIIVSCIFIFIIHDEQKYDEELYSDIYKEYEEFEEMVASSNTNDSETKQNISNKKDSNYSSSSQTNDGIENNNNDTAPLSIQSDSYVEKRTPSYNSDKVIGKITIPKINVKYPILNKTTEEYLKIAPTRLAGPNVNEEGNLCIIGHNSKNDKFFSKLSELKHNDMVVLTDAKGDTIEYRIYEKNVVKENDLSCINQDTNGNTILTLITCTKNKSERLVVKCKAI